MLLSAAVSVFFFPVTALISADEHKEETAQLHFSEAMFSNHPLPPVCELFNAIISAASYLQSPAGCGRWKTEETKEQDSNLFSPDSGFDQFLNLRLKSEVLKHYLFFLHCTSLR